MNYYGRFCRSQLHPLLARINYHVGEWLRARYRRLRPRIALRKAWERVTAQYPAALPHWQWATGSTGESKKSPVAGDCHAGI